MKSFVKFIYNMAAMTYYTHLQFLNYGHLEYVSMTTYMIQHGSVGAAQLHVWQIIFYMIF
jgi:hypothetical protein